jgi:hypothetical protein
MRLSVGVLYDCQKFFSFCATEAFFLNDVRTAFAYRYEAAPISAVLDMMRAANWVSFDDDGRLRLTSRGRQILECGSPVDALRLQIMDYIVLVKPPWSSLIPRGRVETLPFLPPEARQCFNEAGLSEGYGGDVVAFWDRAANLSRGRSDDILLEIGREGERLSIEYESRRTGKVPVWKAVDSNLAGYDLLSVLSREDDRPLKIEVKASQRVDERAFYLTKNEWDCATGYGEYVLHLWLLGVDPKLLVWKPDAIASHVPVDQGNGTWQSTKIAVLTSNINLQARDDY